MLIGQGPPLSTDRQTTMLMSLTADPSPQSLTRLSPLSLITTAHDLTHLSEHWQNGRLTHASYSDHLNGNEAQSTRKIIRLRHRPAFQMTSHRLQYRKSLRRAARLTNSVERFPIRLDASAETVDSKAACSSDRQLRRRSSPFLAGNDEEPHPFPNTSDAFLRHQMPRKMPLSRRSVSCSPNGEGGDRISSRPPGKSPCPTKTHGQWLAQLNDPCCRSSTRTSSPHPKRSKSLSFRRSPISSTAWTTCRETESETSFATPSRKVLPRLGTSISTMRLASTSRFLTRWTHRTGDRVAARSPPWTWRASIASVRFWNPKAEAGHWTTNRQRRFWSEFH